MPRNHHAVKPQIRLSRHGFSGGLGLDGNGSFFADDDDDGRRYAAAPSPEVDRAWYELLTGLNIDLEDPGEHLRRTTFRWPESGLYLTGLEVFHSLHCLDRLRQALYPEYYRHVFSNPNNPSREDHIGHCINHLRQAIQCHGDLTPMVWKLAGDKIILSTETRHMCRDFDRIHEWAAQRQTRFEDIEGIRNGSLFLVD
ncbi:Cyclochlorotine biosynthesis protein O [Colletotrichum sidae]|uniref:Cyclochlorotine biosynthesis protein O n=1 Tax=Colletotrichum sidae TaxID=1347389 RepID=A0A4R8TRH0_9PEZI|nr:Cyclochlorotine biosynthesis protein O [Colletotrichum sidae]